MLAPRLSDRARPARSRAADRELIERIRADGWRVENYQIPLISDERRAGSTLPQRLALVAVAADCEVDAVLLVHAGAGARADLGLWA